MDQSALMTNKISIRYFNLDKKNGICLSVKNQTVIVSYKEKGTII